VILAFNSDVRPRLKIKCAIITMHNKNAAGCRVDLIRMPRYVAFIRCSHRGPERGVARDIDQKISVCDENVHGLSRNRQNPRGA